MPQDPRNQEEEAYFLRSLATMSGIIRNCGFIWFYPPFEARMWILYEVAAYTLTCFESFEATPDIREFADHVQEMLRAGVRSVLEKYEYRCTYERDKAYLTSWLEVLVLLRRLGIGIAYTRRLLDGLTWSPMAKKISVQTADGSFLQLCRFEGNFTCSGECYTFTPFPKWVSFAYFVMTIIFVNSIEQEGGKYSINSRR